MEPPEISVPASTPSKRPAFPMSVGSSPNVMVNHNNNEVPNKTTSKSSLQQTRSSPDLSGSARKRPSGLAPNVPSLSLSGSFSSSSPGLRPLAPSSAPNTPELSLDRKRATPATRFLQKEKLLPPSAGTPTHQQQRKRGGSFMQNPSLGTPTSSKPRKPIAVSITPPLDADYDYDFRGHLPLPDLPRREGSVVNGIGSNPNETSPATNSAKRKSVAAANPLIADKASQWGQSDRLEDWVAKINLARSNDAAPVARGDREVGEIVTSSSGSDSSDSSSEDDTSGDSDDSSNSSSDSDDSEVTELESKDSRTRFLEEEDDLLSSSESLNGSRVSRSQPPLSADVVRLRAAKELEVLASLVPARVLYAHASGLRPRGSHLRAMREEFDGAVLFADISGFSRLAELLVRRQTPSNAAESLTKYVGWNLHEMVEVICSKGGDVMKFAGDAILAVFAADQFDGSLPKAAMCCAQAALSLQGLELSAGDAKLSVHSGMGVGRVATYEVGGLQDRWEVFVAGPPVEQIGRCEPQAKAGELVISSQARQCIEKLSRVRGVMVEDGNFRLDKILDPIEFKERPSVAKQLANLAWEDPDKALDLKRTLQKYLSRPVIFSIEGHGQTLWGAELRVCSTLFVKFKGLKFAEQSEEDLALVQHVVKNVVQKVMAELEGTVCRFMVDDKGAAMLLAFGLIPFCHPNDSARAVKAALMIRDGVAALSLTRPNPELQKRNQGARKSMEDMSTPPPPPAATLDPQAITNSGSSNNNNNNNNNVESSKSSVGDVSKSTMASQSSTQQHEGSVDSSSPGKPIDFKKRVSSRFKIQQEGTTVRSVLVKEYAPIPTQPVSCQIGITRGKVCVGMVGGSTRCEYTLHGVLVNRAARLMGSATDAVILCDHDTYLEARNEVEFDPNPVILQLKGERKQVKVYKPVRKASQVLSSRQRSAGQRDEVPRTEEEEDAGFVGRMKERMETEEIFKQLNGESPWSALIGVQGDSGIGKSRMMQYVARVAKKHKVTVLSGSALDTESSTPFYAWKSVIIQLISIASTFRSTAPAAASTQLLQSVSSKETMTSFGSAHSFSSTGFNNTPKSSRKQRSASRPTVSPSLALQSLPPEVPAPHRLNSPKGTTTQLPFPPSKRFDDMTPEEKKDCLIDALPLEKRELYPLLAPFVDEIIPPSLLAENEATTTIVRNQRVTVATETVVAMISYFATRLQQRGERLAIMLEDLQFMDASSLDLLLQVAKTVPRHVIFCSGTFSEENGLAKRVPCTTIWALQGLDKHDIARCMKQWLHVSKVSEAAVNMIYEKSNGNPLFSEELCRLMNDNHYFEISNDVCVLTNTGASGETRMNLPNSIIALMTASLDRLNAAQQIVLRVVSVMGMQFTLHDLAGVLHAINKMSTNKLFGGGGGSESNLKPVGNVKFDINDQEMTLEQMLKEGAPSFSSVPVSNASPSQHPARSSSFFSGMVSTPVMIGNKTSGLGVALSTPMSTTTVTVPGSTQSINSNPNNLTMNSSSTSSSLESISVLQPSSSGTNLMAGTTFGKPKSSSHDSAGGMGDEAAAGGGGGQQQQNTQYPTIKVNVNQVLTSLVQKGILEEKTGFVGSRKVYCFRHAMMKETACDELLREESKQTLHQIIGEYYEDRPITDYAQHYAILAEHFYAAQDKVKARKYLEQAGEYAVQNHATQQVYQCYSRLIKLAIGEEVPDLTRAQWSRKVGEALYHMDRTLQAEESLHKALEILQLDCRDAPAVSGTEAGYFRKPSEGCLGMNSLDDESTDLPRQRPRGLTGFFSRLFCVNQDDYDDDFYAEDFEQFIVKSDVNDGLSAAGGVGGFIGSGSKTPSNSGLMTPIGGMTPRNSGEDMHNSSPSKRSSGLRYSLNNRIQGANSSSKLKPRQRTMSMVEPQSPLRPRLLLRMPSFQALKEKVICGTQAERSEAIEVLLEAAIVYDLLGRMLRDRSSSVALERRLNAMMLAEAAAIVLEEKLPSPPKKKRGSPWGSTWFGRSSRMSKSSQSSPSENMTFLYSQASQYGVDSTTINTNAHVGGGGSPNTPTTPNTNANASAAINTQQRILDELSRSYSRAAVFFAGMHPGTRWRGLAKKYAFNANSLLQAHGGSVSRADLAQHSENLVLLQQRCGEYDAMQGNFMEACEKLRFAVWGARFMHLDRARVDSKVLELTVFFFNGDMDSCNTTACELFEKNTSSKNVALGTRFMALCGEYDIAIHKLRALAKLNGPVAFGVDDEELSSLERGLDALGDANAWLALSLVAWRKDQNGKLALRAATQAAEQVLCSEMSDAPLVSFHTVALCFTAIWDPLRDSPHGVVLVERGRDAQMLEHLLKRLLSVVRGYAVIYKVCRPHALYCVAIRSSILHRIYAAFAERDALEMTSESSSHHNTQATPTTGTPGEGAGVDGQQPSSTKRGSPPPQQQQQEPAEQTVSGGGPQASYEAQQVPQSQGSSGPEEALGGGTMLEYQPPPKSRPSMSSWLNSCLPLGQQDERESDPFEECANAANKAMCYWVEGLARLEMEDIESWWYAKDVFSQYNHAEYEVIRCERKLAEVGYQFPEEGEESDGPIVDANAGNLL